MLTKLVPVMFVSLLALPALADGSRCGPNTRCGFSKPISARQARPLIVEKVLKQDPGAKGHMSVHMLGKPGELVRKFWVSTVRKAGPNGRLHAGGIVRGEVNLGNKTVKITGRIALAKGGPRNK